MSVGPIAPLPAAAGVQPVAATTAPSATAAVSAQAESPVVAEVAAEVMAGPEAALSAMISDAVTQQTSLAPLFADIAAAMSSPSLPPEARATMAAILASQTPLDETTSAAQLRAAAQSSGVFLEAGLAAEVQGEPAASANIQTDLKALLLKLVSDLAPPPQEPDPNAPGASPSPTAAAPSGSAAPPAQAAAAAEETPSSTPPAAGAAQPTGAAATSAQESAPVSQDGASTAPPPMASGATVAISEMAARDLATGDLAPTAQGSQPSAQGNLTVPTRADATASSAQSAQAARPAPPVASPRATPQPPIAGGPTAGQPAVRAIVGPHDAPESLIQTLRQEAIGALARVQLSQAASVPRSDAALRWSFEAPIATPDGTAIGQFEIDRDGKGDASKDGTGPTWRARFSLDLSPSGPVHAEISLSGGRTRVVLMAEREGARLALASGQDALAAALAGENGGEAAVRVVSDGPQRPTPPAGQMLDKST
jgi:hypothetical protein